MATRQAGCYSPGYSGGAGPGPPGVSGPVSRSVSGSASGRVTLGGDVRSGAVGRRGAPGAAPPGVRSGAGLRGAARPWCLPRCGRCHTPDYRREMPGPFGSHSIKRRGAERGPTVSISPFIKDATSRFVGRSYSFGAAGKAWREAGSPTGWAGTARDALRTGVVAGRPVRRGVRRTGPGLKAFGHRHAPPPSPGKEILPGKGETERNAPEKEIREGVEGVNHRAAADREKPESAVKGREPRPRPLTRAGAASPGRRARSVPPPPPARCRPRSTPGASGATPGGGPCTGRPRGAGADSR